LLGTPGVKASRPLQKPGVPTKNLASSPAH
jgi:hypothetical protein